MEAIQQTFNGSPQATGSTLTSTISRNGDLVSDLWLEIDITNSTSEKKGFTNDAGNAFVKECELEIGGQRIDKHTSKWLNIWNTLTDKDNAYGHGLHKTEKMDVPDPGSTMPSGAALKHRFYVPLQFWFCRNPGLALPLIALQYHEVKLKLTTRDVNGLFILGFGVTSPGGLSDHPPYGDILTNSSNTWSHTKELVKPDVRLFADYIYLDTDERRRFAQVSHEYLIEQLQIEEGAMVSSKKLNFNHPVKSLIWVIQDDAVFVTNKEAQATKAAGCNPGGYQPMVSLATSTFNDFPGANSAIIKSNYAAAPGLGDVTVAANTIIPLYTTSGATIKGNDYFNYDVVKPTNQHAECTGGGPVTSYQFKTAKLELNGHERFSKRSPSYFTLCQRAQADMHISGETVHNIYVYSFALKPLEHQPSGTCNFSRIDNAKLIFEIGKQGDGTAQSAYSGSGQTITVFAVNYNVLRIMSGMGGLAYSN